jgi:hypothetical protein
MRHSAFSLLMFTAAIAACGSSSSASGAGGAGGAGDGKFHPPPSGAHTTEKAACDELVKAIDSDRMAIAGGCVGTGAVCPQFLRIQSGFTCVEYDEGSVQGCIAYYAMATTCDDLATRASDCVAMAYEATMSMGCM